LHDVRSGNYRDISIEGQGACGRDCCIGERLVNVAGCAARASVSGSSAVTGGIQFLSIQVNAAFLCCGAFNSNFNDCPTLRGKPAGCVAIALWRVGRGVRSSATDAALCKGEWHAGGVVAGLLWLLVWLAGLALASSRSGCIGSGGGVGAGAVSQEGAGVGLAVVLEY